MAIIAVAVVKLARLTDKRDPKLWAITLAIRVITAVTGAEIALLFVGAGLLMVLVEAPPRFRRDARISGADGRLPRPWPWRAPAPRSRS